MAKEPYGVTSDGREIDDAMVNELAAEAERGYSPAELAEKPRGSGPPPFGRQAKTARSVDRDAAPDKKPDLTQAPAHAENRMF